MNTICCTNRIEEIMLDCYRSKIPVVDEVCSRIAGLLLSPAAAIDIIFHAVLTPLSIVYAIGKSIITCEADFSLPWQHIQRVRDAVFPLFFGSLLAWIHPYAGTYSAVPTKKCIATGILLSGTNQNIQTIVSPLTAFDEIISLAENQLSSNELTMLRQLADDEADFEAIQSVEFFHLNLTKNWMGTVVREIDSEFVKRIALLAYPILAALDLAVLLISSAFCFASHIVSLIGGQAPFYLENEASLQVLIFNIVKIPLFIISATVGWLFSVVNPEEGVQFISNQFNGFVEMLFQLKMRGIESRLDQMIPSEKMILPIVKKEESDNILPAQNSHMFYVIIHCVGEEQYEVELVDRLQLRGKTEILTARSTASLLNQILAPRYKFAQSVHRINYPFFFPKRLPALTNGCQTLNNCVITNLFAAFSVLKPDSFNGFCQEFKRNTIKRYSHYAKDFYPFGDIATVVLEIQARFSRPI